MTRTLILLKSGKQFFFVFFILPLSKRPESQGANEGMKEQGENEEEFHKYLGHHSIRGAGGPCVEDIQLSTPPP